MDEEGIALRRSLRFPPALEWNDAFCGVYITVSLRRLYSGSDKQIQQIRSDRQSASRTKDGGL